MDSKNIADGKESRSTSHNNPAGSIQTDVLPMEPPPSYKEAMENSPRQDSSNSNPLPSAPVLENDQSSSCINDGNIPAQFIQAGIPPPHDKRFDKWDDKATDILIKKRLELNDRFNKANTEWERDILWNLILHDLITSGYRDLVILDLIQFWEFQIHIYRCILNSLMNRDGSSTWQYFEPMNSVFGNANGCGSHFDSLNTSSTVINPMIVPNTSTSFSTGLQQTTGNSELPKSIESSNINSASNLPSSPLLDNSNVNPSSITQPISDTTSAENKATNENSPLLIQNTGNNESILNTSVPNDIESNKAVIHSIQTSSANGIINGASDLTSVKDPATLSGEMPLLNPPINNINLGTITTQPDSATKLMGDEVISTQPTVYTVLHPTTTPGHTTNSNDDCCCLCCFMPTYHSNNYYDYDDYNTGDGCCGDSGGNCCDDGSGDCGGDCGDCDFS